MKTMNEIMQHVPSSCKKNDRLQIIELLMSGSSIDMLTVVDDDTRVIGRVIYKDVKEAIEKKTRLKIQNLCVADVMKTEIHLINAYDDEAMALNIMRNKKSSSLTVVDEKNHLKGVVSFITFARRIIQLKRELRKDEERLKVQGLGLSV